MRRISPALLSALALAVMGCERKPTTGEGSHQAVPAPPASTAAAQPAPPSTEDTILIGEVGSLTGSEVTFGSSTQRGIELAINEASAEGGVKGKKILVHIYDYQSKPEEAGNAATRLIAQDKVKLILGEVASTNSKAMAVKTQEGKVPMISLSSTNVTVTEIGDYIFRVCFIDPFQGFVMAKFAKENLKLNRVAGLKDAKSDYSPGLTDVFTRKFTEMGGKIVSTAAYSKGDTDFRAQLTNIKAHKPEAIYVPGYYSDVGVIAKQARELGVRVPLLGGDGWDSPKLFELGGTAVVGNYFSNHYSAESPTPKVKE